MQICSQQSTKKQSWQEAGAPALHAMLLYAMCHAKHVQGLWQLTPSWEAGGGTGTAMGVRAALSLAAFSALSWACSRSNTSCLWSICCWACCTSPPSCIDTQALLSCHLHEGLTEPPCRHDALHVTSMQSHIRRAVSANAIWFCWLTVRVLGVASLKQGRRTGISGNLTALEHS